VTVQAARSAFEALPWVDVAPGARSKTAEHGPVRLRLLELTSAFAEDGWCVRGHAGLVLEGAIEITLRSRTFEAWKGEGIFLPPGEAGAHRARALTERAVLFLVEESSGHRAR
jgi:hypothetical protein